MYNPPDCKTLAEAVKQQKRIGIQGFAGTGKTWSSLTFPNPIVLNLDRGLGAHIGRNDIIEVPLYDIDFCKKVNPNHRDIRTVKDTILIWLDKYGRKLELDQTLVVDGGTGIQNAYHAWYENNKVVSRSSGSYDEFAQWRLKLVFFGDICEILKELHCDVIYICHESEKKEKSGDYLGKIRPLLTGQFVDQLVSHFTDWFRQLAIDKPKSFDDDGFIKTFGLASKEEAKLLCEQYPRNTIYCWQTDSDNNTDCKASSLIDFPKLIPANYQSFMKYTRK